MATVPASRATPQRRRARPPRAGAVGRALRATERTELALLALAVLVLAFIAGMVAYVMVEAWPSFRANGLGWFGSGGDVNQQLRDIYRSPAQPDRFVYELSAWPLIAGTLISTLLAAALGSVLAVLSALFLVEFAPPPIAKLMTPVVRLLAAVPSVVYGLVGILVIAPWIGRHLLDQDFRLAVQPVVPISGAGLLAATLVLTVMITPIMVSIVADALRSVPRSWIEGSAALGVNRWRTMSKIAVRTARPAIAAALVLACARALGEAIMLAMVGGSFGFAPNPLDGLNAVTEPIQPLAATIVVNSEGLSVKPFQQTLYAFAAVLLVSTAVLSFAGWAAKQPMRRYGLR